MYLQAIYQEGVFLFFRDFLSHMGSIGGTKRKVGVAEREASTYTDIIGEFPLSDIFTTIFTTK